MEVPTPVMRQVMLVPLSEADYGITDRARRDILINLEELRRGLSECNTTIRLYNESVRGSSDTGGSSKEKVSN